MKLYFSPLACSLATRIALYEAGASAEFVEVYPRTKLTADGCDFRTVHSLGLVPTLELEPAPGARQILTENAAILQYVAGLYPEARLAPAEPWQRARLQQWLCFIGTELHKALYTPLLDKTSPPVVREYALARSQSRLGWLSDQIGARPFLLDHFTVADAYLFAVLNWSSVTPVDLGPFPAIRTYQQGLRQRPSVARAFSEELALYQAERDRQAAAAV
jgi:glutathione S-transferase